MTPRRKRIIARSLASGLCLAGVLALQAFVPAQAQEAGFTQSAWPEDGDREDDSLNKNRDDLNPRPLTLADLERLVTEAGLPEEERGRKRKSFGKDGRPESPFSLDKQAPEESALQQLYAARAGEDLPLFGYDLFDRDKKGEKQDSSSLPAGSISDDYVLSTGDRLDLIVRGQENRRKTYEVNSQGLLVTDEFGPLMAAGQTLGAVRKALEDEAATQPNMDLYLSLSTARQIDVLVIGDVESPGRKHLTAFHTILDALNAGGGVSPMGSLRQIKLVRGGNSRFIDLYKVLLHGGDGSGDDADIRLQDGDRLIVPPVGPTVAVAGAVKRPGIYEIRKGEQLSALELLGLAGGVLAPGNNRFIQLSLTPTGKEMVEDVKEPTARAFGDGSILSVAQTKERRSRNITLSGETRSPGQYDIEKTQNLSALIGDDIALADDVYPLLGLVERLDRQELAKTYLEFSPARIVRGKDNMTLAEGDRVLLFSLSQIRTLTAQKAGSLDDPEQTLLHKASLTAGKDAEEEDFTKNPAIRSFLQERAAFVRGAVRYPGSYPVAADTSLPSLVAAAGGLTVEADPANVEVTYANPAEDAKDSGRQTYDLKAKALAVRIAPGDMIRINQKFNRVQDQSITLLGEVKRPGKYDLRPGDTMMSLLQRAGGLTDIAYPDGVIFSRASERRQEESRYKAQARDLEMKLASALQQKNKNDQPDAGQVNAAQALIAQLRDAKAVGRITVEADPGVLTADPEQNILLEGGDKIYIPRRPLTVRVGGEVLSPAALQFRRAKEADDYIDEAGGTTYYADKDRSFVVYPDGSAKPLRISAWNHADNLIPPGSTIIVPRDPKPFDFLESAEKISTIMANIALTGFYIDDLGDDD